MRNPSKLCLILAVLLTLSGLPAKAEGPARNSNPIVPLDPVVDVNGVAAVLASTPIYITPDFCPSMPAILAPDGHAITLGEWMTIQGRASVKCTNLRTHVVIHLKGLIPNGVYSMWIATFNAPGFTPNFENVKAGGALGPPDGSKNTFRASASGEAQISAIHPAGPLSEFGTVGNCLLDEFEVHLAGAYHLDGLTHGGSPGEPGDTCSWALPFAFSFKKP